MSVLDDIVETVLADWDASNKPLDWKNADISLRTACEEVARRCADHVRGAEIAGDHDESDPWWSTYHLSLGIAHDYIEDAFPTAFPEDTP